MQLKSTALAAALCIFIALISKTTATYPRCNTVTCPTSYPAGNKCTLVNRVPYLITLNFLNYTIAACKKIIPSTQLDLDECNHIQCQEGGLSTTLMACDVPDQSVCVQRHGTAPYKCPGASGANKNMCVCTPCGIALKPGSLSG
ncbi:MAG: hypothetical protein J3R72DRAFT_442714 [Linnemannia gamsii]|nr:MAG: hypothetical protein J3R72DRAFT_442714 [Linnemannia gamsii]